LHGIQTKTIGISLDHIKVKISKKITFFAENEPMKTNGWKTTVKNEPIETNGSKRTIKIGRLEITA
jgi:hypothetical protein